MAYNKTLWQNNSLPAINAGNLNKIEQGIYEAHNNIGDLSNLDTTNKSNLVGAINEVNNNCSINNQNINATGDIIEITPLVGSNYNNYGNTYYYKVGSIVYLHIGLKGLIANAENVIFTLPAGYRPRGYACGIGVSDNMLSTAVVQIGSDGTITIRPSSRHALIDMSFISFQ